MLNIHDVLHAADKVTNQFQAAADASRDAPELSSWARAEAIATKNQASNPKPRPFVGLQI